MIHQGNTVKRVVHEGNEVQRIMEGGIVKFPRLRRAGAAMTALNVPLPYMVSCSSQLNSTYAPWRAFSDDNNQWVSGSNTYNVTTGEGNEWVQMDFKEPTTVYQIGHSGMSSNATLNAFRLQGSNDLNTWDILLERESGIVVPPTKVSYIALDKVGTYRYYRYVITKLHVIGGTYAGLKNLRFYTDYNDVPKELVPIMTGASAPSPVAITESSYVTTTYRGWKAFDGINNTSWCTNNSTFPSSNNYEGSEYMQINLGASYPVCGIKLKMDFADDTKLGMAPVSWELMGSNSTSSGYVSIISKNDEPVWEFNEERMYEFNLTTPYRYYRVYLKKTHGESQYGRGALGTVQLYTN